MKLGDAERKALLHLARGHADAGSVGVAVWPNRSGPIIASQGGGDYAAQMLLGRLRKRGLVQVRNQYGSSRWELTGQGEQALKFIHGVDEPPCEGCPNRFCSDFELCHRKVTS